MKQTKKRKVDDSVNDVVIWDIHLLDGDWYYVFARSEKEALRIVINTHYEMRTCEFRNQFAPKIRRIPDNEKILVKRRGPRTAMVGCQAVGKGRAARAVLFQHLHLIVSR